VASRTSLTEPSFSCCRWAVLALSPGFADGLVDRIQLEEALTAVAELLQQALSRSPEVVCQGPVAIGLLDDSDFVLDARHADRVGTLPKLILGDALGQCVIPDGYTEPLVGGLASTKTAPHSEQALFRASRSLISVLMVVM